MKTSSLLVLFASLTLSHFAKAQEARLQNMALELRNARETSKSLEDFTNHPSGREATEQKLLRLIALEGGEKVCAEFANLKTPALVELGEVVEELQSGSLPCKDAVLQRLDLYYQAKEEILEAQIPAQLRTAKFSNQSLVTPVYIYNRGGGISLPHDQPLPKGTVALTFDDGPHPSRTDKVLDILAQEGVYATFFCLGQTAHASPDVVQRIYQNGHSVGTHTYSHADLAHSSQEKGVDQITTGIRLVENALGRDIEPFFRFPYGARTRYLRSYLQNKGISDFLWDIDSEDWKHPGDPDTVLANTLSQVRHLQRGIILMHDIHSQTNAMLRSLIRTLKNEGYSFAIFKDGR
jgi:peptidoglycan/xylan/chitin deacetylase (PgdA/CDA1 family)